MTEEARKIVETIKEAFDVFSAMELPAEEQKIEITRDAAMTLIAQLEQVTRERDAAVQDINMLCQCDVCTRLCKYDKPNPYCECADFEWRGMEEE